MSYFLKFYLPVYFFAFVILVFVVSSIRIYKQTGYNPFSFSRADNTHDYVGFCIKIIFCCTFISMLVFSLGEQVYKYLFPVWFLQTTATQIVGLVLIHFSIIWIIIAQTQIYKANHKSRGSNPSSNLVTSGLFKKSRNPVFLGILVTFTGIFLIIPDVITFCALIAAFLSVQVQVRMEEEYLKNVHGPVYEEYRSKVRKWI